MSGAHRRPLSFEILEKRQLLATASPLATLPSITVSDPVAGEFARTASFTLSLSAPSIGPVSVLYATESDTATSGDFIVRHGRITFPRGVTSRTIDIPLIHDNLVENVEQFRLRLSNPLNATLAKSVGVATISDDDATTVNLGRKTATANPHTTLDITVKLTQRSSVPTAVQIDTLDGTATAGVNYVPLVQHIIVFEPGERLKHIKVQLLDGADTRTTFYVVASHASGLNVTLGVSQTLVTLQRSKTTVVKPVGDEQLITFQQYTGLLSNPDVGYQTFYASANTDPNVVQRAIPSEVYYTRVRWSDLEKTLGVYDWSVIDREFNAAKAAGQKFAFRIMPFEESDAGPLAYRRAGLPGYSFTVAGTNTWVPDYNNPAVQSQMTALIVALGRRYGNDPLLSSVDIGFVGRWGEMHYYQCTPAPPMPTTASWKWLIDSFRANFSCPLLVNSDLIDSNAEAFRYAMSKGLGWRDDGWSDPWEMNVLLPQVLAAAPDAWKTSPVILETSGTMKDTAAWRAALTWAIQNHVSAFNNKGAAIPLTLLPSVKDLLTQIGYRYSLSTAQHATQIAAGNSFLLTLDWMNTGNAPLYLDRNIFVKIGEKVLDLGHNMKGFLPGTRTDVLNVSTAGLAPGTYSIQIGLGAPGQTNPDINLAIQGGSNGWYSAGSITVT